VKTLLKFFCLILSIPFLILGLGVIFVAAAWKLLTGKGE